MVGTVVYKIGRDEANTKKDGQITLRKPSGHQDDSMCVLYDETLGRAVCSHVNRTDAMQDWIENKESSTTTSMNTNESDTNF